MTYTAVSRPARRHWLICIALLLGSFLATWLISRALWSDVGGESTPTVTTQVPEASAAPLADGGELPGGVGVDDTRYAAVTKLDPALRSALRAAARDAKGDGVQILITSGWRSAAYQERLLEEAVAQYGSKKEAARWVASPDTSAHVSGDAVDLGPEQAQRWLADHGSDFGLCRVYANEPWHFELRPDAIDRGCPKLYADPTKDPRMKG